MDQLTLSCMMCKMDSSTDSDSEISPRWSDTSTLGCVSSAPESRTSCRTVALTYKSAGRHGCCSLFLDPYDGSSEDSEEPNGASREKRQQGGRSGSGQRRRLLRHHAASLTVSEMVTNSSRDSSTHYQSVVHQSVSYSTKGNHAMDVEVQLGGSGLDAGCSPGFLPPEERSSCRISSCSSLRPLCKRKELPPGGQVEAEPMKRQCVRNMEEEADEQ
ncbi:uncharacterized protein LOC102232350 isoform X1 [Xiphophorus maculatus]|uniref:uncharacterized protein LOC102232350 isoform X1 n=2 Tax=Xiphophorus maculatus TaxID=8083 RepID=UPI000C6EBA41|nr:uncharacterized protein LOC102232350 isoform X1 [Xiphophorus maculatus]XP_023209002.1 uncharacterized protein LOC102232350 isoform X1 [Xiphophorus maculatus]